VRVSRFYFIFNLIVIKCLFGCGKQSLFNTPGPISIVF
jgi:hypothetical protein